LDARERAAAAPLRSTARCADRSIKTTVESVVRYSGTAMMNRVIEKIRAWLIGAIKEAVAPLAKPPAKSGHVQFMKFAAARSLLADGLSIEQAAVVVGVEPQDLRAWLSPRSRFRH
jgi:hypothetical protein